MPIIGGLRARQTRRTCQRLRILGQLFAGNSGCGRPELLDNVPRTWTNARGAPPTCAHLVPATFRVLVFTDGDACATLGEESLERRPDVEQARARFGRGLVTRAGSRLRLQRRREGRWRLRRGRSPAP